MKSILRNYKNRLAKHLDSAIVLTKEMLKQYTKYKNELIKFVCENDLVQKFEKSYIFIIKSCRLYYTNFLSSTINNLENSKEIIIIKT